MNRHTPKGLVLPSVMALLLFIAAATLMMGRQLWQQERLLRWQGERLRCRAIASAVLQIALQDLLAADVQADGNPNWRQRMGEDGQTHVFFPHSMAEREVLRARIGPVGCREGICVTDNVLGNDQALPSPTLTQWLSKTDQAWPLARQTLADAAQAWYWIEVIPSVQDVAQDLTPPSAPSRFYYRITAAVQGKWPGAGIALQAVWQREAWPLADAAASTTSSSDARQGHWLSWRWLYP